MCFDWFGCFGLSFFVVCLVYVWGYLVCLDFYFLFFFVWDFAGGWLGFFACFWGVCWVFV